MALSSCIHPIDDQRNPTVLWIETPLKKNTKSKISQFRTEEIGKGENENNPFGVEDIVEKRGRLSVPDEFFEIEKNIGCCSWREIFVSQT